MPNFWSWVKTESRANNWVKFKQLSQIDSKDGFDSKHWASFFLSVVAEYEWWQDEINQLLFADDAALVADSEEKVCRLVNEFGRVWERRKLRVNVGKSVVMWRSRYGNGGRMHVILNGEPLEEVDCFKYLGSQVAADGWCEMDVVNRMNEGYRAWRALKSLLSNRGLGIKAKKCLYEWVIIVPWAF